jgi:hypothetical protein
MQPDDKPDNQDTARTLAAVDRAHERVLLDELASETLADEWAAEREEVGPCAG